MHIAWVFLFVTIPGYIPMHMTLIKNTDTSPVTTRAYKIARIVYAQTGATSLPLVEAFTSMIKNISEKSGMPILDIVGDSSLFPVLCKTDVNHHRMAIPANDRAFQMCVRTASRMLHGCLPDCCYGATKYHSANVIPDWATSRGYIADVDGFLFYA